MRSSTTGLQLVRIGAWFNPRYRDDDRTEFVVQAEAFGYPTAWLGFGRASISDLALVERVLDATANITVATAIVNMWTNDAADIARAYQRIASRLSPLARNTAAVSSAVITVSVSAPEGFGMTTDCCIGAVGGDDVARVHAVAQGLAHLAALAVLDHGVDEDIAERDGAGAVAEGEAEC